MRERTPEDIMRHFDWLSHHARNTPERACWADLHSNRNFTFAQADDRARRLAAHLARHCDVTKGDRIAVLAMNSTDMLEIHAACAKLGAIFLPLNWRLMPPEIDFILSDAAPTVLIHDSDNRETVTRLTTRPGHVIETTGSGGTSAYEAAIAASNTDHPTPEVMLEDTWSLLYTSGTTGRPKGAPNTFGMTLINAINLGFPTEITPRSRGLTVLPLFHTAGLNCFASVLLHAGGSSLVMRAFDPGQALDIIGDAQTGLTHFFGVPAIYLFMSQHPDFATTDFLRLVACGVGGAPSPVPLVNTYIEKGVSLFQGFGMSETSPLVSMQTRELGRAKPGSAGRCALHGELKIMREDGAPAATDEVGELLVRGPNITPGYWNRPEANKTDWVDGWFRTGDAARLDGDGDLWIVDRWKDMWAPRFFNVLGA
jgi:fatty-acyl-CoA synthase